MTTTVTVKTHDWPVQVLGFPLVDRQPVEGGEYEGLAIVPPNSEQEFHVHCGQDVLVKELPIPE